MKQFFLALMMVVLAGGASLFCGCSKEQATELTEQDVIGSIKSALKNGELLERYPKDQMAYLCLAYNGAQELEEKWPDSVVVADFLAESADQLAGIPALVYESSIDAKDLDKFKWAIERSIEVDLSYDALVKTWEQGRAWRNYFVTEYPEEVLSVFMNCAIKEYDIKFFNTYIEAFKQKGYQVDSPLEQGEFNARFCRFVAEELRDAVAEKDEDRIVFLLDYMPPLPSVIYVDEATKKSMRKLGDYVAGELRNEALACKLVELGYGQSRVNLAASGFGTNYVQALAADPEYAIVSVLGLDRWRGALSEQEVDFLLSEPGVAMGLVHSQYVTPLIKAVLDKGDSEQALQLIKYREETNPLSSASYNELLNWAVASGDTVVFEYVMSQCSEMSIYNINLVTLASNYDMFVKYAPTIFRRIYKTMDTDARKDGVTYGRAYEVLKSKYHRAGLYIVQKTNWQDSWVKVTEGRTLLMDVCFAGNLPAARYLIEQRGADVRAETGYMRLEVSMFGRSESKEGKLSPLFFAASSGNPKLIEYLIAKGAQVNATSAYGATPLMYAVSGNHIDAVKMLISRGARVNARMNSNLSMSEMAELGSLEEISNAYRRARKNGNVEMLKMLHAAGARP